VHRLCEFYPGICLTTEEKARKTLSQVKKNLGGRQFLTYKGTLAIHAVWTAHSNQHTSQTSWQPLDLQMKSPSTIHCYTGCPTTYQTRQFFNNSNTNDDIATRFEQEYVCCVRNKEECVCSAPNCWDTEQRSAS
jgi:hypothetical protein